MRIYHQCGHNFVWNLESLLEDEVGEGLIISPVNIDCEKLPERIPDEVLRRSWLDPQFYLPAHVKSKLETYPFFPGVVMEDFTTADFAEYAHDVASRCLEYQRNLDLSYLVVPTRYFEDLPDDHLGQLSALFVEPFLSACAEKRTTRPILLSVIAKEFQLEDSLARDELLTWATSFRDVAGIYLIFDYSSYSKQIKDPGLLAGMLRFINILRLNGLEVHIGYSGLEGLLLSVSDPTSVSVGSFENVRSFGIQRFEVDEPRQRRGPRPRIYSGRLLQWIEDTNVPPLRELVPNWEALFDESPYKAYLLDPASTLNFQRSEIYKHYFYVFEKQIRSLPILAERPSFIQERANEALNLFDGIARQGIVLDADSDGSHLTSWLNALSMYEASPE